MKNVIILFLVFLLVMFTTFFLDRKKLNGTILSIIGTQKNTPISDIISNTKKHNDTFLSITGVVGGGFGLLGNGLYKLHEAGNEIYVLTKNSIPVQGTTVTVKGYINQAFKTNDQQLLVLIESEDVKNQ